MHYLPQAPRLLILAEAQKQFFANGYNKVIMTDLAKSLGMSKKTLYQYFRGKEELLKAVVKSYLEELQQEVEQILQQPDVDFIQKAHQLSQKVVQRFSPINGQLIADMKRHAPTSWQLLEAYRTEAAFSRFRGLLEEGKLHGYIRPDANLSLAVALYGSSLEKVLDPDFIRAAPASFVQELPDSPAALYQQLLEHILHGIVQKQ